MEKEFEQKSRKLLMFDLEQDKLKEYYPKPSASTNPQYHTKAYKDIEIFFRNSDWEHKQGSGYISNQEISSYDIVNLLFKMVIQMPWLGKCISNFDIGIAPKLHDYKDTIQSITSYIEEKDITHRSTPEQ